MTFRVRPFQLPVSPHPESGVMLYPHQVDMWNRWDTAGTMLLAAKTGTGKTRAAMLPVLKRRERAIAIYPTNELLKDQVRAVAAFATVIGLRSLIWTPGQWKADTRATEYSQASHIFVPIDAALLDVWQRVMNCKSRGETIRRLLNPDKPKIVFTNPDILFLILALRYHAEPFEALRSYTTLIVDEFHLYQGVELAHALALIAMARGFGFFSRGVLLSATPHPEVQALLDQSLQPALIDSRTTSQAGDQWRTAVHEVEVTPLQVAYEDPIDHIVPQLLTLRPELERLRAERNEEAYIPAVVIVNSVFGAIRLEDRLVESGFPRDTLAIIRGLSNRAIRTVKGSILALGTSAIEVGVDFDCDYLLFEASDGASFLQRFGRVGRHRTGKAIALVPPNVFAGMGDLPPEIDRAAFEERVYAWYPAGAVCPWFVTTEFGMITARALAENFISTVQSDSAAGPDLITRLREMADVIFEELASRLDCGPQDRQAKETFERCRAGNRSAAWLDAYRKLNRFRTSLPSIRVHDFMEHSRRREWRLGEYDADLASLLRRGVEISWNDKLGTVTIRGIGKYRRVHASDIFDEHDCGMILQTVDCENLRLYQDGRSTPVSDLMGGENHIFSVVPKKSVERELSWRTPVFEAGGYFIAFDGAALLLLEMWKRFGFKHSRVR